jgi:hypothetical protein
MAGLPHARAPSRMPGTLGAASQPSLFVADWTASGQLLVITALTLDALCVVSLSLSLSLSASPLSHTLSHILTHPHTHLNIYDKHTPLPSPHLLVRWLCERLLPKGGINGRPDKPADACYAWWVCASLAILGALDRIDRAAVTCHLLSLQCEGGGFSSRPRVSADLFHTHFALAALALLRCPGVAELSPVYCLPRALGPMPASPVPSMSARSA